MNELSDIEELRYRTLEGGRDLPARIRHFLFYLREYGPRRTLRKIYQKLAFPDGSISYDYYRRLVATKRGELKRQRSEGLPNGAKLLVIVYGDGELPDYREQTYRNFSVVRAAEQIPVGRGEWIVFSDTDATLEPDAFYEIAKCIRDKKCDMLYSDEDIAYRKHIYKCDFNPALLCEKNYMGNLLAISASVISGDVIGYGDRYSYDFILRCVEAGGSIAHIPKVLYHGSGKTAPVDKDADIRAIEAHLKRQGVSAKVSPTEYEGLYDTRIIPDEKSLITIVIPSFEHTDILKVCIDSIWERSAYRNFEILVVENNSKDPETFRYYEKLEAEGKARVIYYDGKFNFSAINNLAVKSARGDYILLLNNDTELISPELLERMLGWCSIEGVGLVGAKLFFPDMTLQHVGVILGLGGVAGHLHVKEPGDSRGYCDRAVTTQDLSAVTAACMMVKKSVYNELGGLNEELRVAYNDIDFCVRVKKAGYRIIYCAEARMIHYESKSRGLEDRPEKLARYSEEYNYMRRHYGGYLDRDPYYNPNLNLKNSDCRLMDQP